MESTTDNLSHWQYYQRQSPAAIFILLGTTALNLLKAFWPVLLIYFFRNEQDSGSLMLVWTLLGFSTLSVIGAFTGYWFKKFRIDEETLTVKSGWLNKKTLSIPIESIQAVHLDQNVWQQVFKVARVSFESTGSGKVEVKLEALRLEKAEQLKQLLTEKAATATQEAGEEIPVNHKTYKLQLSDLVKLGLTANHLEAFFILLALGLNIFDELRQVFGDISYLDAYAEQLIAQTVLVLWILFIGITILSILYSFFRTFLRFYGFELVDSEDKWTLSYGLTDRSKKIIPIRKIQILSWQANWIRRKANYWTVQIQSLGGRENGKTNVLIPLTSFGQAVQLAQGYQDFEKIGYTGSNKIEPEIWKRRSLLRGLPIILLLLAVGFYLVSWPGVYLLVLLPVPVWYYYQWYRHFRWQCDDKGLQILSGFFGRKYQLFSWKKVQQVHLHQSLYQRNRQLADVSFITAGGKVTLPFLKLPVARALVDYVLYDVESKAESWM